MTGKNKKELIIENSELKKELSELRISHAQLSVKAKSKCNKCDENVERMTEVRTHQDTHNYLNQSFKCANCDHTFNDEWKMEAHLKTCKTSRCDLCNKTFKCEDI